MSWKSLRGDKLSYEQMVAYFTDAYMRHLATMS